MSTVFSQQAIEINGVVKVKHTDSVLPYAQVVLDGTTIGTVTGEDGTFQLTGIPVGEYILKVMYAGYKTELIELTIAGNGVNNYDILLQQSPISIEEILVTGNAPMALASNNYIHCRLGFFEVV